MEEGEEADLILPVWKIHPLPVGEWLGLHEGSDALPRFAHANGQESCQVMLAALKAPDCKGHRLREVAAIHRDKHLARIVRCRADLPARAKPMGKAS
jgi:hypothetical protein